MLSRVEGGILFASLLLYIVFLVVQGRKERKADAKEASLTLTLPALQKAPNQKVIGQLT
jgi:hypothetical protein